MREDFIITRQGKKYALYAGLLEEGHARGLKGIDTDLLQVPIPENNDVAIVKAVVEMEDGRTFSGIGDASPENVGRTIAPHIIRMAETRAKARALRDAVNVGIASLEEMSDGDDVPSPSPAPQTNGRRGRNRSGSSSSPVRAVENAAQGVSAQDKEKQPTPARRGTNQKARKSQVDLLRTLAEELRGENGVARLEGRIGKSLSELTRAEADEWIDRLTPAEGQEAASGE